MGYSSEFPWREFYERFVNQHEEFSFYCRGKELVLSNVSADGVVVGYGVMKNGAFDEKDVKEYKSPSEFLSDPLFDGKTLHEIWDELYDTFLSEIYPWEEFTGHFTEDHCEFSFSFRGKEIRLYDVSSDSVTVGYGVTKDGAFDEKDVKKYKSPSEFLSDPLFDGKTLHEIWDELSEFDMRDKTSEDEENEKDKISQFFPYKKLKSDFSDLKNYGFEFSSKKRIDRCPAVIYKRDGDVVKIGFDFYLNSFFVFFNDTEIVRARSRRESYKRQAAKAKQALIRVLKDREV